MNWNHEDHIEIRKGKNPLVAVGLNYDPELLGLTWVGLWDKGAGLGIGLGVGGQVCGGLVLGSCWAGADTGLCERETGEWAWQQAGWLA
jgi:hypothetical protein